MYFTTAGYFIAGLDLQGARRAAWKAVCNDPRYVLTRKGLHKAAYACFALSPGYGLARRLVRQVRLRPLA